MTDNYPGDTASTGGPPQEAEVKTDQDKAAETVGRRDRGRIHVIAGLGSGPWPGFFVSGDVIELHRARRHTLGSLVGSGFFNDQEFVEGLKQGVLKAFRSIKKSAFCYV
jgi:hypothetical protein